VTTQPLRGAPLGPAGSSRVQRKRGQRMQQIVRTAAELFGERGYDAVSLDDVAERLDVTKGLLYYYFASKDDLATAAIETLGSEWTARLQELSDTLGGPVAGRLQSLIHEHLTIAVSDYPAALRLFLEPRAWPAPQAARIKDLRRRHDQVFRSVVEEGVAAGEFTVTSIDTTLQCMHAAMAQAPLWCAPLGRRARERAIGELTATLMMLVGKLPPNGRLRIRTIEMVICGDLREPQAITREGDAIAETFNRLNRQLAESVVLRTQNEVAGLFGPPGSIGLARALSRPGGILRPHPQRQRAEGAGLTHRPRKTKDQ
jgi:AcrR family transcriptional regulator